MPKTAAGLNAAIYEAFEGYVPVWACSGEEYPNMILDVGFNVTFNDHPRQYKGSFEIYRCVCVAFYDHPRQYKGFLEICTYNR